MPVYARVMLICCFAAMLLASVLWAASYAWPIYPGNATFKNESVKADATSVHGQAGVRVYIGELPFMAQFDPCNDEVWSEYRLLPASFAIYPGRKLDFGMEVEVGRYAVVAASYWFLFAASGLTAFLIWKLVPRRRINGTYSRCGYDLRASANTCPECGTVFENSDQSRVTILPGTQAITTCMRTILILFVVLATTACQSARRTVTSQQQAVALIQAYERAYLQSVHGPNANMPLTSAQPPHLVLETEDTYKVEFRGPANTPQGLDIKVFHVNQYTGKVTRGMWTTAK